MTHWKWCEKIERQFEIAFFWWSDIVALKHPKKHQPWFWMVLLDDLFMSCLNWLTTKHLFLWPMKSQKLTLISFFLKNNCKASANNFWMRFHQQAAGDSVWWPSTLWHLSEIETWTNSGGAFCMPNRLKNFHLPSLLAPSARCFLMTFKNVSMNEWNNQFF